MPHCQPIFTAIDRAEPSTHCLCARRPGEARKLLDDRSSDDCYMYLEPSMYFLGFTPNVVFGFFRRLLPCVNGEEPESPIRMMSTRGKGRSAKEEDKGFVNGQVVAHKDYPKLPVVLLTAMRGAFAQGFEVDAVPEALRAYWTPAKGNASGVFTVFIVYQPFKSIERQHQGEKYFYELKDDPADAFTFMKVEDLIPFVADASAHCKYVSVVATSIKYPRTCILNHPSPRALYT